MSLLPTTSHLDNSGLTRFTARIRSVRIRPGGHWWVVGTVCIGAFMAALDASIINIALPTMQRDFHVRMAAIEWVSLAYLLTLAALIVPFGRLADMLGRNRMYTTGFVIFTIGSGLCGLSPTLGLILGARIIQAVGAAMLQANSLSIVTIAAGRDRSKAIGIQASAQGIGLSLGPAIGGTILSTIGWRWIFYVNLPVGLIGIIAAVLLLDRDRKPERSERFDFLGAILLAPALVSLVFVLKQGPTVGWLTGIMPYAIVICAIALASFIAVERRLSQPMLDLRLFGFADIAFGTVTGILSFAVMYAVTLLGPFYMDGPLHFPAFEAGLYMTIVPIGMTVCTPVSGALADRYGPRSLTLLGMGTSAAGCALLGIPGGSLQRIVLIAGLFLVGAGLGLFTPPNNSSVMGAAPRDRLGITGGLLNVARTLGMALGVTLGGVTYQLFLMRQGADERNASTLQMTHAYHGSFLVVAAIAIFALVLSLRTRLSTTSR